MSKSANMSGRDISRLKQAAEDLHNQDRDYRRASNKDFFIYIVLVLVVAFALRAFVGEPILVQGDSMYPTLFDNERIIVEKLSYYAAPPQRGDIIVCFYPGYTVSCVKRIIGLPGDTVEITGGKVMVNGAALDETLYWGDQIFDEMRLHVVDRNTLFVMGDNRNYSSDSRDPRIGDIPYEKIVGKAVCVMWPFDRLRAIWHVNYS
ncbi:MAG: signal peptidase I [Clostridiales bacterium]|jgi:signal peptidase I|nr:signal peptidase I [Clostridiales bacterium]